MKVKDLIEALQKLPQDLMVVRDGYEGGLTEINNVETEHIVLNVNEEWYYGKHEIADDEDEDVVEAIFIG